MTTKKWIGIAGMFCILMIPSFLMAQQQNSPEILVVTRFHFDLSSKHTREEWRAVEKEYFDKVTAKNNYILGTNVLVHYFTDDNSEVLFASVYHSWDDMQKANDRDDELARAAWPDSLKRLAFFNNRRSFYTTKHSDEIRSIAGRNWKGSPNDTVSRVYYVRTSHRAFPDDAKPGELTAMEKEYADNVIQKNALIKGYYPSRHLWGADSREFVEVTVFDSLSDLEKAFAASETLENQHWPDEAKRKAFFDRFDKYFEPWHGDAIYRNVPALRKVTN